MQGSTVRGGTEFVRRTSEEWRRVSIAAGADENAVRRILNTAESS
jgi:hypothetical protein